MASLNDLKELFKSQEEKDISRREKEKEEEDVKRKEDKEEVKEMFKSHMKSMTEDIKGIKIKQDQIEGQVLESENKLTKKYDDMASKVTNLENKLKEIEEKEKAKKVEREENARTWPAIHPEGRHHSSGQPAQLALHPVGRQQSSCEPATQLEAGQVDTNKQIYSLVRQARKTIGLSPITDKNVREVMEEMQIENIQMGMEEVVKDFLRAEMAMPEEVIMKLKFYKIFRRAGEPKQDDDKLFVEFTEEGMQNMVFKYVRKMRSQCNIHTFIPEAFRERAAVMERAAYRLRHSDPSYNTRIKWGWGDLILERKTRGSREQYTLVQMTDLPPVDLLATPRVRLPTPTSSPAPGRKDRKKRARSQDSPIHPQGHKASREEDRLEKTPELGPRSAPPSGLDAGFFSPINFVTPKGSSLPNNMSKPDFQ